MENKESTNRDLENLLRKKLQEIDQKPDADTWAKIASRQSVPNHWLQLRQYALYALPLVLAVIALGVWKYQPFATTTPDPTLTPTPTPIRPPAAPAAEIPVANIPETEPAQPSSKTATSRAYPLRVTALSRINTVPAAVVRFQSTNGIHYESPTTGTKVRIPANALVDADGQPVQGEVELMLREYRDISDFLASGIPMHYGDERGTFFFNSGGMFEVRVSQNGEPLSMAPGESYEVLFSPTSELTNASLYYFDESDSAWKYRPDQAFGQSTESARKLQGPPVVPEAVAVRNNRQSNGLPCLPALADLPVNGDAAQWINDGVRVGYELATEQLKMPIWFRKNPNLSAEALLNGTERGMVRMVRNQDLGELFFPEDLNNFFTELKAFKGCYFVRSTDSTNNTAPAPKALNPDIYWDQIVVSQELGNEVRIYLYSEKEGVLQFYADLTASIGNKTFNVDKVMAEYKRLRKERLNNFEALVNSMHRFIFTASMFQKETEWCLSPIEWIEYFEAQLPAMAKRYEALVQAGLSTDKSVAQDAWKKWRARVKEAYLTRADEAWKSPNAVLGKKQAIEYALKVNAFGIYNCDQIFRLGRSPQYIIANYRTDSGDQVYASSVSVLERQSRLYFTLPYPEKMIQAQGRALDIIVTDRNGRQYHLAGDQYARMDFTKREIGNFTVKDITDKVLSPRDWTTYLEM